MASPGPIDRYTSSVNTAAKTGCTRPAKRRRPSAFATAITPSTGKPIALRIKPAMAGQVFVPACAPRKGGKIRLPAPKNMENNVNPTSSRFFPRSRCISLPLFLLFISLIILCFPFPRKYAH